MSDNNLQWKQKYYNSLDEIERREKKWHELEELFKQAISRLTIAAEGNSKKLDEGLLQLRTAIRKGKDNNAIESILEYVSKEIIRLDSIIKEGPKGDAGFLLKIIGQLPLTGKAEKKARKLSKHLNAKNPPEQVQLLSDFNELLMTYVQQMLTEQEKHKHEEQSVQSGFLKKLFSHNHDRLSDSSHETSSADSIAQSPVYSVDESLSVNEHSINLNQEQMSSVVATVQNVLESVIDGLNINNDAKKQLKDKIFTLKPTREIHVLLDDLQSILKNAGHLDNKDCESPMEHNDVLIRLIELLPLEDDIKERAEHLKDHFASGINDQELPEALKSIAGLIGQMHGNVKREQKEFETFLKKLTGKLAEVDLYLQNNIQEHQDSYQSGINLDDAVKAQVKDIGHTVSSVNNIEDMEKSVQIHLDKILTHVNNHRSEEDKRVSRVELQNKKLSEQLKKLEEQSHQLRQQVIESQNKALTDPLTQLPNRLAYDERLSQEFARWKRYNSTLLIMVWDIDYFKKVNDNYGHQAGDKVLKVVADLLRKNLRETDFIARFGGEEFVGLMPETSLAGGYKIAEKIRASVELLEFHYRGNNVKITISCGISLFIENDTVENAFERADTALYQAKKEGRNRCVIIEPGQ